MFSVIQAGHKTVTAEKIELSLEIQQIEIIKHCR